LTQLIGYYTQVINIFGYLRLTCAAGTGKPAMNFHVGSIAGFFCFTANQTPTNPLSLAVAALAMGGMLWSRKRLLQT
jgi:hypothetical protein